MFVLCLYDISEILQAGAENRIKKGGEKGEKALN